MNIFSLLSYIIVQLFHSISSLDATVTFFRSYFTVFHCTFDYEETAPTKSLSEEENNK